MFASLAVCTTSRDALADLLARMYFWTRPSLSRSLVGRHPCWTAACFLPCTSPPDLPRLRLRRPTRRPGPSERDARRAYALTRSGFQTMPTRRDEDEVTEGAASATARGARAPRFGTRAHAPMTPPSPHTSMKNGYTSVTRPRSEVGATTEARETLSHDLRRGRQSSP
jgi:hypothetical protein